MKCVFLIASGETMEGLEEMQSLNYDCQAYPVSQDVQLLRDSRFEEFSSFLGGSPARCDKPVARSLRVSFAKMLTDSAFDNDDFIIFGESDGTPIVPAAELCSVLKKAMQEHPEVDVFRPFWNVAWTPSNAPAPDSLHFEPFHASSKTSDSSYAWGTHALIIPAKSRHKIANLFLDCRIPTDTALEAAAGNGEIKMMVLNHNAFYQKPRTTSADITKLYSRRTRKMALCLSSYRRPEDLQRQMFTMLNQSYENFHLFVAVKGIPEFFVNTFITPLFQNFIDAGKLTIRCFPNGNQLTNLLDTVRGLDVSEYELFLKIDDDDFYGRDYLTIINEFYTTIPQFHSCCYCNDWNWVLYKPHGLVSPQLEPYYVFGASMVLSREVMSRLFEAEKNPDIIKETMLRHNGSAHSRIAFSEDNFIDKVMNDFGKSNIAPFVARKGVRHFLMVQKSNPSVTRGGLVPGDAACRVDLSDKEAPREEIVFIFHSQWKDSIRLYGKSAMRASNGDRATVLRRTEDLLVLRWDRWDTEAFVRDTRGAFVPCPLPCEFVHFSDSLETIPQA